MAYQPRLFFQGLRLYTPGRKPATSVKKYVCRLGADGLLARRKLEFYALGRVFRRAAADRKALPAEMAGKEMPSPGNRAWS